VRLTETIEAKQQAPEFVFPGEQAVDRAETLFKYSWLNSGLQPCLGCLLPREFGLMLGIMPRLKMALRLRRQS
jgi:hypothetical protein